MTDTAAANAGDLEAKHQAAEAKNHAYTYAKPDGMGTGKGFVNLGRSDIVKGMVQVVKKDGGENNLHYHTRMDTFWMVLKGRVRFYGPDDVVLGEFGPHEGTITPRFSRYWFENVGDGDLELLQVAAYVEGAKDGGRTDASPQKYEIGTAERFEAAKA